MSKKVFISAGHGGSDPGAVGNGFNEKDLNLSISLACRDYLQNNGVEVKMSRTTDTDPDEIKQSNDYGPDLTVDIHNNAGGGDGAEVWYSINGGTGKVLAENILAEIVKIGQNSRGIKTRKGSSGKDYYGFIRNTIAPAVIVECAFVDNANDIAIIDTEEERKAMGVAIAKGILKTLGITEATKPVETPVQPKTFNPYKIKVTTSALNIRKGPGTDYDVTGVIRDSGVYTIVDENGTWGKLKSGAGWISLKYCRKL